MLTFPPDSSFLIQIVSFLLLLAALRRLAFDPILNVLEEREKRTHGQMAEAEAMRAAASDGAQKYEAALQDVRRKVSQENEAARQQIQAEQQRQLAAAHQAAEADLAKLRTDLAAQVQAARASLSVEAGALAALMAERVSGRSLA